VTTFDLTKGDDGQVYLQPKEYEVEFEPKNAKAHLGNLFNGNEVLGGFRTCAVPKHAVELPGD
jgi:hypothetical protein